MTHADAPTHHDAPSAYPNVTTTYPPVSSLPYADRYGSYATQPSYSSPSQPSAYTSPSPTYTPDSYKTSPSSLLSADYAKATDLYSRSLAQDTSLQRSYMPPAAPAFTRPYPGVSSAATGIAGQDPLPYTSTSAGPDSLAAVKPEYWYNQLNMTSPGQPRSLTSNFAPHMSPALESLDSSKMYEKSLGMYEKSLGKVPSCQLPFGAPQPYDYSKYSL